MSPRFDPNVGLITKIDLDLKLPADFPEKYKAAVVNAINDALAPLNARVARQPVTPEVVLEALGLI
jgi:hypothetical protein